MNIVGIQRKKVYCRHIETQQRVGDSSCDSETKPDFYIRDCVMSECPYMLVISVVESCATISIVCFLIIAVMVQW